MIKLQFMNREFQAPDWVHSASIYEVNIRQYTEEGTLNAFSKHLSRLRKMGVDTLWFMPLTPISIKNRKGTLGSYYACSDYTSINPEFGNIEDCKSLFTEAQSMGFKIIIDWVANHTGWDHKWTVSHPEYYIIDPDTKDFKIASGMDDIIVLNYENPELCQAMINAMCFWVNDMNVDGFRCDLASWVKLDFWKQARTEIEKIKPLFWLGEFDELENPEYGEVFDASYSWKWMHLTEDFYKKRLPLSELVSLLKKYSALGDNTLRCWFTSNHDENSWNGTEYEKYGPMAIALAVFSFTWKGIPLIYSGQELPNHQRLKFFDKDTILWTKAPQLETFYQQLISWHSFNGDMHLLKTTAPEQVLAWIRNGNGKHLQVILNLSPAHAVFRITDENNEYALEPWGFQVKEK